MNSVFALMLVASVGWRSEDLSPQLLRSLYYQASQKSSDAEKFYNVMIQASEESPLLLGYKGMAEFMKCYHSYNPVTKLSYFYKGKSDLDQAVLLAPNEVELRYLRFTVQTNVPPFLNYKGDIKRDKKFLMQNIMSIQRDRELLSMIREFMIVSDFCNDQEKAFFQNIE